MSLGTIGRGPIGRGTIAIDPGNRGALVYLRADGTVGLIKHWRKLSRKGGDVFRVFTAWPATETACALELPSLSSVGDVTYPPYEVGFDLVVEGLYGRGRTLESLAWNAGVAASKLLDFAEVVHRPQATTWRREMLSKQPGKTSASEWARVSVAEAAILASKEPEVVGAVLRNEHVADAYHMARWGRAQRRRMP